MIPLRTIGVRIAAGALYHSGALKLLSRAQGDGEQSRADYPFAVLLYHRVNSENNPFFPAVPVRVFSDQMKYLANNFRVCSLEQIVNAISSGGCVARNTVAITFDDGYRDNYLYAHPILAKYHLPATLFAATGYIGNGRMLWNDRIAAAFERTPKTSLSFNHRSVRRTFPMKTIEERVSSFINLLEILKVLEESEKEALVRWIVSELGAETGCRSDLMLKWSELRQMANEGWEIGSHTVNHVVLTRVPEPQVQSELVTSKKTLENELQRPVRYFAYPNGKSRDFSGSSKEILRAAGYSAALTSLGGFNGAGVDLYELYRRNPWEEFLPHFASRLVYDYWKAGTRRAGESSANRRIVMSA